MKNIGIKNTQICEFMQIEKGITINTLDVASITTKLDPEISKIETFELAEFMYQINGNYELFSIHKETTDIILGVFTQTKEEEYNLMTYGDVLFFDGTKVNNSLNWEVFPITLIDNNRELISGGVFFLGLETTEVFDWTLKIMEDRTNSRFSTIFY